MSTVKDAVRALPSADVLFLDKKKSQEMKPYRRAAFVGYLISMLAFAGIVSVFYPDTGSTRPAELFAVVLLVLAGILVSLASAFGFVVLYQMHLMRRTSS